MTSRQFLSLCNDGPQAVHDTEFKEADIQSEIEHIFVDV